MRRVRVAPAPAPVGMGTAMRVAGEAFRLLGRRFFFLALVNLGVGALCLPLIVGIGYVAASFGATHLMPFILTLLFVILPCPVVAALHTLVHQIAAGEIVHLSDGWDGMRRHFGLTLRLWLVSIIVTGALVGNLVFYGRVHFLGSDILKIIWIYFLFAWLGIQVYVYPLITGGELRGIWPVYRLAIAHALSSPAFTALVTAIWLLVAATTTATGLVLFFGLAWCAALQHLAAREVSSRVRGEPSDMTATG